MELWHNGDKWGHRVNYSDKWIRQRRIAEENIYVYQPTVGKFSIHYETSEN